MNGPHSGTRLRVVRLRAGGSDDALPPEDRDGVVKGYERCGLACGEEPTSGENQTEYGCEQGYITGELCSRYN